MNLNSFKLPRASLSTQVRGAVLFGFLISFVSLPCDDAFAQAKPAAQTAVAAQTGATSGSNTNTSANTPKDVLKNALPQLETAEPLTAWQKQIFEEEALPQADRFVRSSGDVDLERLKKFLAFYAKDKPEKAGSEENHLALYYRFDQACERCQALQPKIRPQVLAALNRRGFIPVFVTADQLGDRTLIGKELEERVWEESRRRNYAAALTIQVSQAGGAGAPEDRDAISVEEPKIFIRSHLMLRDSSQRSSGQIEMAAASETESSPPVSRLLSDAFYELGGKALLVTGLRKAEQSGEEIALVVRGVSGYSRYWGLKAQLESRLKDLASVEERKFSRGQVIFGIRAQKTAPEVRAMLGTFQLETGDKLVFLPEGPQSSQNGPGGNSAIESSESQDRTLKAELMAQNQTSEKSR